MQLMKVSYPRLAAGGSIPCPVVSHAWRSLKARDRSSSQGIDGGSGLPMIEAVLLC